MSQVSVTAPQVARRAGQVAAVGVGDGDDGLAAVPLKHLAADRGAPGLEAIPNG